MYGTTKNDVYHSCHIKNLIFDEIVWNSLLLLNIQFDNNTPFFGREDKSSNRVFISLWYLLHLLHALHSVIWIYSSVPLNNEDQAAKASCHWRNHLLWRVTCELWMSSLCLWSQSTGKILKVSGKPTMLPRSPSWMRICILMHSETLGIHFQRTGFERKKITRFESNCTITKLKKEELNVAISDKSAKSIITSILFTVFSLQ